ncbi:peptidoglycan-binding protein [Virgibacillus natechei]
MIRRNGLILLISLFLVFCFIPLTVTAEDEREPVKLDKQVESSMDERTGTVHEIEVDDEENHTQDEAENNEAGDNFSENGEYLDDLIPEELPESLPTSYEDGASGSHITELKQDLTELGFGKYSSIPNEYYGDYTEEIIGSFQSYYELASTGIANEETLETIGAILANSHNKQAEDVISLKEVLEWAGFLEVDELTPKYDDSTEQAVKDFQAEYELVVNGIVDPVTYEKLSDITSDFDGRGAEKEEASEQEEPVADKTEKEEASKQEEPATDETEKEGVPEQGELVEAEEKKEEDSNHNDKEKERLSKELAYGTTTEEVVDLKVDLEALGFHVSDSQTPYFGDKTKEIVKNFQNYYGVAEDKHGVVSKATLAKIEELTVSPFQYGGYSEGNITLKEKLESLGYHVSNNPTTYFGTSTEQAVMEFQKDNELVVNGIADPVTWDKIEELIAKSQKTNPLSISTFSTQQTGVYSTGDYHKDVVDLKTKLAQLGFHVSSNPTTYYGSKTENAVRDFQSYYGLMVDGIAGAETFGKIDKILSSPFQEGSYNNETINLKEGLAELGFHVSSNPTTYYGNKTAQAVRDFQEEHGLVVNGIADPMTRDKIDELLSGMDDSYSGTLSYGDYHEDVITLKEDLDALGFHVSSNPTTYYGDKTADAVKDFQSYYGLLVDGIAGDETFGKINEILSTPHQYGGYHQRNIQIKEDLAALGFHVSSNPTTYYGDKTADAVRDFQVAYGLSVNGIADEVTLRWLNEVETGNAVKIFLDAGHGGHDPGGKGHGLREKDVVLDIALKTADELTSNFRGVNVQLSRTDDTFVELEERANMANNWGADYFVSFHVNVFNGTAGGFESFIYNGNVSNETRNRQEDIHSYLSNRIPVNDRGMKRENFSVLRNTHMSAILLEYMFIDNWAENAYLKDASNRSQLASITAEAIAYSFNLQRR